MMIYGPKTLAKKLNTSYLGCYICMQVQRQILVETTQPFLKENKILERKQKQKTKNKSQQDFSGRFDDTTKLLKQPEGSLKDQVQKLSPLQNEFSQVIYHPQGFTELWGVNDILYFTLC